MIRQRGLIRNRPLQPLFKFDMATAISEHRGIYQHATRSMPGLGNYRHSPLPPDFPLSG